MPILKDNRKSKKITLPVSGAVVEIYTSLLAGDIEKIQEKGKTSDFIYPLTLLLRSWDFTDENQNPCPINEENVRMLDIMDVKAIQSEVENQDFFTKLTDGANA